MTGLKLIQKDRDMCKKKTVLNKTPIQSSHNFLKLFFRCFDRNFSELFHQFFNCK